MRAFFIAGLFSLIFSSVLPVAGQSQGVGSLFTGTGTAEAADTPDIDLIMRRAAENGVGVVVIDNSGQILGDLPASEAELAESEGPSSMMRMQDRAAKFRAALVERLLTLPVAFNEVLYILRAASPDGTLWA
ncbi:MAG: mechanosensitive ion channel family protein, partial [Tateyamaria sp.]